jgi:hypothetical protein
MPARSILAASFSLVLLLSFALPTGAQYFEPMGEGPRRPHAKLPPPSESARVKGTIKALEGNLMQVIPENGKDPILVQMPAEVQNIKLTGKALAAWLSPGLTVRLIGRFDLRGKAQDPIRKLDVITLRKPVPGEVTELPGVYPQIEADAGGGAFDGAGAGGRGKSRAREQGGTFKVIGQITAIRNHQMMVSTGAVNVMVEVAQDAEIAVEIGDYRFASVGDTVELDGGYYPQAPNQIYARRVTIQSAQPLGSPDEEGRPRAESAGKPGSRPGKGKGRDKEKLPF